MIKIRTIIFRRPKTNLIVATLLLFSLISGIAGLEYWSEMQLAVIPGQPSVAPKGQISIIVKISECILELYSDGKLYKTYRIAVGQSETPTPVGDWSVVWKSYRTGVFGTRYFGLSVPWGGYGIHGTNQPWSIGRSVSQGCIRMRNKDIEELYEWVPVGTPVRIEDRPLRICRTLSYETSGADVVQLQRRLRDIGYFEGRADGFFDKETELAVKRFQYDKGLKPTGVADMKTLEMLDL